MFQSMHFASFAKYVFDTPDLAQKAGILLEALLKAQSPRLSDIAQKMPNKPDANYKQIQRFLAAADPQAALLRLFQADAPFVLADPTEIPRPQARHTPYVGILSDGQTPGFWLLTLATPFRGRAIPFSFVTYSSRTIAQEASSRNLKHFQAFATLKGLIGDKPLIADREFSYLELLEALVTEHIHFVIRLHLGSHPPHLLDENGQPINLDITPGETVIRRKVSYKGQVRVNLIGVWHSGFHEPMWVMTDLRPEQGLDLYVQRMKIEESFRDLKSLLRLHKLMNHRQVHMEKMVALVMLAFSVGLWTGESLRDALYAEPVEPGTEVPSEEQVPGQPTLRQGRKWKLYSGLFVLLKQKIDLPVEQLQTLWHTVLTTFRQLVQLPVRTLV